MHQFMLGVVVMACLTISLLFLRFWRRSGDRLFLFFAGAFLLMAANWFALAFIRSDEANTPLYGVRLAAFSIILLGIWDKNRVARGARAGRDRGLIN
jgi:hypothetical protein